MRAYPDPLSAMAGGIKDSIAEHHIGKRMDAEVLMEALLPMAVELNILELRDVGGPTEADMQRLPEFAKQIGGDHLRQDEKGKTIPHPRLGSSGAEALLYKGDKPGDTAKMFNELAFCLAVMSFGVGGVKFAGMCWHNYPGETCWHRNPWVPSTPAKSKSVRVRQRLHKIRKRRQ